MNSTLLAQDQYTWIVKLAHLGFAAYLWFRRILGLVHVVSLRHGTNSANAELFITITHRIVGDEDIGVYLGVVVGFSWSLSLTCVDRKIWHRMMSCGQSGVLFSLISYRLTNLFLVNCHHLCRSESLRLWKCAICLARWHLGWLQQLQEVPHHQENHCTEM